MNNHFYMSLPYDLSGARSKNRFRFELLWGLSKIYDAYEQGHSNFCIIFDYVCDIELHLEDGTLEFFQIKTKKSAASYTLEQILKIEKGNNSILGKLFILKANSSNYDAPIKLAIVSNLPFQAAGKIYGNKESTEIIEIDDSSKEKIKAALKSELLLLDVDLNDIAYVHTSLDLYNPNETLLGKTVDFFLAQKGVEAIKPKALFNSLISIIEQRATYELSPSDYDDTKKKKGVSKHEVDLILNEHLEISEISVERAIVFINENCKNYKDKINKKKMLTEIFRRTQDKNNYLLEIERKLSSYIHENIDQFDLDELDLIDLIQKKNQDLFPIEFDEDSKFALILLVLKRYEEGVYKCLQ